ncbi:MAG: RodZ domain-containing protein [Pseudomonadota bacterium]
MSAETKEMSFGRYLREARETKRIRLEDISNETKIGIHQLIQLENEDLQHLPEAVYVKGFIRAYAKAVGGDGDEAIRLYVSSIIEIDHPVIPETDLDENRKRFWPRITIALLGLAGIVLVSVVLISFFQSEKPIPKEHPREETPPPGAANSEKAPTQTPLAKPAEGDTAKPSPEELLLNVRVISNTWLEIGSDDQDPKSYNLKAGDLLTFKASSGFQVHIGNAGGVEMELNGKPIPIEGKTGQVIRMKIP